MERAFEMKTRFFYNFLLTSEAMETVVDLFIQEQHKNIFLFLFDHIINRDSQAFKFLGDHYLKGEGVKRDETMGYILFEVAAGYGNTRAKEALQAFCSEVLNNDTLAVFRQLLKGDVLPTMNRVIQLYAEKEFIPALTWLHLCVYLFDYPLAHSWIGIIYMRQNWHANRAASHLEIAAKAGMPDAQYFSALLYSQTKSRVFNPELAKYWLTQFIQNDSSSQTVNVITLRKKLIQKAIERKLNSFSHAEHYQVDQLEEFLFDHSAKDCPFGCPYEAHP
jgi:TPR repeat protein